MNNGNKQELILKVGAAGGSLSIWSVIAKSSTRSFVVKTDESTLKELMTKEEASGITFKSKTGALRSFADALIALGRNVCASGLHGSCPHSCLEPRGRKGVNPLATQPRKIKRRNLRVAILNKVAHTANKARLIKFIGDIKHVRSL
jgi:hypothetical protein